MFKKCTALFLAAALALSLAACGKTGTGTAAPGNTGASGAGDTAPAGAVTAMGRWVEEKIDLSAFGGEAMLGPAAMDDGSLRLYMRSDAGTSAAAITSADGGKTWSEADPGWGDVGGVCWPLALGPDGTLFFQSRDDAGTLHYYLRRHGGAPQAVDTAGIADLDGFQNCCFYDSGTLLLFPYVVTPITMPSGEVYNTSSPRGDALLLDTETLTFTSVNYDTSLFPELSSSHFAPCAEGFRFCHYSGAVATLALDGSVTAADVPAFNSANGLALTTDADGTAYIACADGIARLADGGTLPEFLVEGLGTQLAAESAYIRSVCRTPDGDLLVNMLENIPAPGENDDASRVSVYRYTFDETLPAVNSDGIEVWTLFDNATVRQAVNVYIQQHGDVDVTLTVGVPDLDAAETFGRSADEVSAINDALTTLNTALLAGAGPDVLILDGVQYKNYIRRGLLADLRAAVPLDELAGNLTAPFVEADGSVYVLPARFSAPVILADDGDTADLASLDTLQAAILAGAPRPADDDSEYYTPLDPKYALDFASANSLGDYLLYTGGAALLHDGALDAAALQRAFTFAQAVGQHYGMAAYTHETENGTVIGGSDAATVWPRSERYLTCDRARWGWEIMQTPALCTMHRKVGGALAGGETVPSTAVSAPGLCSGAWLPGTLAAVSAGSQNQQAALDFVSTLFGAEVQDVYCSDGMPVRSDSLAAAIDRNLADAQSFTGDAAALLAGLQTPVTVPQVLETSFKNHLAALLKGSEDAAAAAAGVQSDLALYLAEQQ